VRERDQHWSVISTEREEGARVQVRSSFAKPDKTNDQFKENEKKGKQPGNGTQQPKKKTARGRDPRTREQTARSQGTGPQNPWKGKRSAGSTSTTTGAGKHVPRAVVFELTVVDEVHTATYRPFPQTKGKRNEVRALRGPSTRRCVRRLTPG